MKLPQLNLRSRKRPSANDIARKAVCARVSYSVPSVITELLLNHSKYTLRTGRG